MRADPRRRRRRDAAGLGGVDRAGRDVAQRVRSCRSAPVIPLLLACGCLGLAACDDVRRVPTGPAVARDAGMARDAADAAPSADADVVDDAAAPDAAEVGDAQPLDARSLDAGRLDASAPLDASTAADAAGPVDAGPTAYGFVGLSQTVVPPSTALTTASAGFYRAGALAPCVQVMDGACTVSDCPVSTTAPPALDGGPLTVRVGARTFTTRYSASDGYYTPDTVMMAVWSGGEAVSFSGAGSAVVPPFTGTLTAPAAVVLTQPALPAPGTPLMITRAAPLTATWQGRGAGEVVVTVAVSGSSRSVSAVCAAPAAAGALTVSSQVLTRLPAGSGSFSSYVRAFDVVTAGSASITVQLTHTVVSSGGGVASVLATLR